METAPRVLWNGRSAGIVAVARVSVLPNRLVPERVDFVTFHCSHHVILRYEDRLRNMDGILAPSSDGWTMRLTLPAGRLQAWDHCRRPTGAAAYSRVAL